LTTAACGHAIQWDERPAMGDGTEPIEDDEYLYRRVSLPYFDRTQGGEPSPWAFRPRKYDITGISLFRAKYTTPEEIARNARGKQYYIAVLRAGDIRSHGLDVVPIPQGHAPGHVEIPSLTHANRRTDAAEEAIQVLARKLCLKILGPFP